jgi:hypothetical protein
MTIFFIFSGRDGSMRIRNHKKKSRAAAILLIAVFSLLQLALWSPSFLHPLHEEGTAATCQHDHALCGCAPSRIASGTCCCALAALSPCCQKNYLQSALEEKAALGTVLTSLPCGGSEDPLVTAGSEAYLLPTMKISDSPVSTTVYPMLAAMSQIDLNILPPIPPPKA